MEVCVVEADWTVRAIRGATTVPENTAEAIREAVAELLDELERHNSFDPEQIVSVTFSVTPDLDALFPASVARQRPHWDEVPLLDVQHMSVKGDLERCVALSDPCQSASQYQVISSLSASGTTTASGLEFIVFRWLVLEAGLFSMLVRLQIENFALIDDLDLKFGPGLNVLTGETGAGKSIVLDAVDLVLGGKASRRAIRTGAKRARVEAWFEVNSPEAGGEAIRLFSGITPGETRLSQ